MLCGRTTPGQANQHPRLHPYNPIAPWAHGTTDLHRRNKGSQPNPSTASVVVTPEAARRALAMEEDPGAMAPLA